MTKEVAIKPVGALDFAAGFSPDQVELLKNTICQKATDDELKLFLYQCTQRKLDPFARQIHSVKRWNNDLGRYVQTSQTGIDGFRLIAQRSGEYRGQTPPMWCGEDSVWKEFWTGPGFPVAAKVGVKRKDFSEPVYGIALWAEYCQYTQKGEPTHMWKTMPSGQLSKCAEALALRKAFPEDLAGLHTDDELAHADNPALPGKADEIQEAIKAAAIAPPKDPNEIDASFTVVPDALTGDALLDYKIPEIVKPLAGQLLGTVTKDRLLQVMATAQAHFEKERREPAGRWAEFFKRADEYLGRLNRTPATEPAWGDGQPSAISAPDREPGSDDA